MKAYSMDLRERVVACDRGDGTHEAVAQRSCVGIAWSLSENSSLKSTSSCH